MLKKSMIWYGRVANIYYMCFKVFVNFKISLKPNNYDFYEIYIDRWEY